MSSAVQAHPLPAGYTQRPATRDDIPVVGALFERSVWMQPVHGSHIFERGRA